MHGHRTTSSLTLALLTATFLTPPCLAQAAPGDALGAEFQVNSFTTGDQWIPAVAMAPDGDFVVAWSGNGAGDDSGVFAQRFDAAGVPLGPEFQVNTVATGHQGAPAVAMDADGDFVVAWLGDSVIVPSDTDIFARRFDAAGAPQGPEFQVNSFTTANQISPAVAMAPDGDFVVTWTGNGVGDDAGVFAQHFDAAGAPQGPEFRINSYTTGVQSLPDIAMDADGDFVVAWASYYSQYGIFARRFDASGVAQGAEFRASTTTTMGQDRPAVAMDADGDFVVTWESYNPGVPFGFWSIFAQRFDAAGVAQGPEFLVSSYTTGSQYGPAVAMDTDGDFVVAWTTFGSRDGSYGGVFAQRFDAAGIAQGPDFQVNSYTTNDQESPALAMDADGDFVVAWESWGPDGSGYGIFAQRFDGAERVEGDFDGDGNADVLWRNAATGNAFVWLMEGTERRAAGSVGVVPVEWEVEGTGDFNGDGKADILWRHTGNGLTVIWQMDGLTKADSAGIGKPPLDWVVEQLRDTDGDGNSDIFWRNSSTGSTLVWRMNGFTKTIVGSPGGAGPEWQVQ